MLRIVLDLQSVQASAFRARGIGRYSLSLALALCQRTGSHEILLALNGAFSDSIQFIRDKFDGLLPPENIRVWYGLTPVHASDPANRWRREAAELLREQFLASLSPDIVLITSLFQGFEENSVISIGACCSNLPTAVIFYDLIPFIYPSAYLMDTAMAAWYHNRLDHLRRAELILAISESSRLEIINHLGVEAGRVITISSAIDSDLFRLQSIGFQTEFQIRRRHNLDRPFLLYTGASDARKNVEGLIAAFARIGDGLRRKYQLAIICTLSDQSRDALIRFAASYGLGPGELAIIDFISDDELVALYNLCHLFVFPSWHEGFGLPALEAMACGAPTLASNCSSLPEVVDWPEALFDPRNEDDIARAITRALTDDTFRQQLIARGLRQVRKFSWDLSAQRALRAMKQFVEGHRKAQPASSPLRSATRRLRLAYISPLQPAKSGVSDYSAELLPELARHYHIDVLVDQEEAVTTPWVLANSTIRSVAWFMEHGHEYDRILYHFGNSASHRHMFALLERFPGVVVLHDFFLSSAVADMDRSGFDPGIWSRILVRDHGWKALCEAHNSETVLDAVNKYPCSRGVLSQAHGIICHSEYSRELAVQCYGPACSEEWTVIPLARSPVIASPRQTARESLGLTDDDFMVCSFGVMGFSKCNLELLEAWLQSSLSADKRCSLVFVGLPPAPDYGERISRVLDASKLEGRVRITGWVDQKTYQTYLLAADLAVQLRTLSRGETSAAILDCLNYGVATIINANGSLAELPANTVHRLPDHFSGTQLATALQRLWRNPSTRMTLGKRAAAFIRQRHSPRQCADLYHAAIERFARKAERGVQNIVAAVGRLGLPDDLRELARFAERAAQAHYCGVRQSRQLLLDVSELAKKDHQTGIQRVVRSVLAELLNNPPNGYRVEPVFATAEDGYRYARAFTARFLGLNEIVMSDDPVEIFRDDIFLGLDWEPGLIFHQRDWLQEIRLRGVKTYFVVYDLLPMTRPEFFPGDIRVATKKWLETLSRADGLICISRSVTIDLENWLQLFGIREGQPLKVAWMHLGADLVREVPGHDFLPLQRHLIEAMAEHPSFLMVGTVEPRKGHMQVLHAFELLWREGIKANLIVVGKSGWKVGLDQAFRQHPERGRRLFWFNGIGDAMLEQIYASGSCLIAASADEGFGLPLIEAARHRLAILARDIPVFREVAGSHASYFRGEAARDMAEAIKSWLELYQRGREPRSHSMPWLTWERSARNLLGIVLNGEWQSQWTPEKEANLVGRYWASDHRFSGEVGERRGKTRCRTGRAGYLLRGPLCSLNRGAYIVTLHGDVGFGGPAGSWIDIVMGQTTRFLARVWIRRDSDDGHGSLARLTFTLNERCDDLEVRVFVEEESDIQVELIEVHEDTTFGGHPVSAGQNKLISWAAHPQPPPAPRKWEYRYWAAHPRLETEIGYHDAGSIWSTARAGFLIYGPHISLRAGRYKATIFGAENRPGGLAPAHMDVTVEHAQIVLGTSTLANLAAMPGVLGIMEFNLEGYSENVEVRAWVNAEADLHITGIEIAELPEMPYAPRTDVRVVNPMRKPLPAWGARLIEGALENSDAPIARMHRPLTAREDVRLPVIGVISTWNSRCGIADYTRSLISGIQTERLRIFANKANEVVRPDEDFVRRCWIQGWDDGLAELFQEICGANVDAVVIQFNFGLYRLTALAWLVDRLRERGILVLVTLHSTMDVIRSDITIRLGEIQPALARTCRLLVHSVHDLNRLKAIGLTENVTLFPMGLPPPFRGNRTTKRELLGLKNRTVIASFGYLLPHKGLRELISAVALLREKVPGVCLMMLNALYPAPESDEELRLCREEIRARSLEENVRLTTDFLEENELLGRLAAADVIVYPYQHTQESASSAVKLGLSSLTPIAVTQLPIFSDIANVSYRLPGKGPSDIADGLVAFFDQVNRTLLRKRQKAWVATHKWSNVSDRLDDLIRGELKHS